jgi:hypothetical protein
MNETSPDLPKPAQGADAPAQDRHRASLDQAEIFRSCQSIQQHDDQRIGQEPSLVENDVQQPATAPGPDLRRRRLMRGAAVAVPTIITLRSGAAAAVSLCPQIKGTATVNGTGKIMSFDNPSWPPVEGDVCTTAVSNRCPNITNILGTVSVEYKNDGSVNSRNCSGISGNNNGTVFIVAESSAASLL